MNHYLELENVRIEYPDFLIEDIKFSIPKGKMLVLLGPSGSGKTTLIQAITGLIPISAGDIRVNGQSIVQIPVHKRKIGIVFQDFALFPHLNIFDNIAFSLKLKKMKSTDIHRKVYDLLDLIELKDYAKRKIFEISGGEKQRVALARTLASDPDIILFDEPMSALDENLRERLRQTIRNIQQKINLTAIYVTHDQQEAFYLADYIGIMQGGKMIAFDNPENIYLTPPSTEVAKFIGIENIFSGKVVSSSQGMAQVKINNLNLAFRNYLNVSVGDQIYVHIKAESCLISDTEQGLNSFICHQLDRQIKGGYLEQRMNLGEVNIYTRHFRSYDSPEDSKSNLYLTIPPESISISRL